MPPVKKPRLDATAAADAAPSTGLTALPPMVLDHVLTYLAEDDALVDNGRAHVMCKFDAFQAMARVSRAWRAIADDAASARALKSLNIRDQYRDYWTENRTRSEVLEIRRKVILRLARIWNFWLRRVLKALELSTFSLQQRPSNRIVDLTRAAVRHCPALQTLTLPGGLAEPFVDELGGSRPRGHHLRALSKVVFDGLKVWAKHGGLRELMFPMHGIMKSGKDAKTYIDNIATFCPRMERLDGYAPPSDEMAFLEGECFLKLDMATWERFCRECDRLECFDWRRLPFATQFFETFGNYPKPNLTLLSFSASGYWFWDKYFKAVDSTTAATLRASGHGASAVRPQVALRATPNLRRLRVEWAEGVLGRRPNDPNPEILGDDFVEAAAASCRQLSHFTHCAVSTDGRESVLTFTDRSMRALAALPQLSWVEVVAVNITGDGLFDLRGGTAMVFYDVLAGFLQRLVDHKEPLQCAERRVALHLINMNDAFVDDGWSAAYFGNVMLLAEQVRAQHLSLQLRGLVRGYNDEFGVMTRVLEFTFATQSAELPRWEEDSTDVEATDVEIYDVFVNRSYYDDISDDE